jgi:hypothetical protein
MAVCGLLLCLDPRRVGLPRSALDAELWIFTTSSELPNKIFDPSGAQVLVATFASCRFAVKAALRWRLFLPGDL